MPAKVEKGSKSGLAVRQIVSSTTENEFLDNLIEGMKISDHGVLISKLEKLSSDRDADIERICTTNHHEFVNSVKKLDQGREDCTKLGNEILSLVQSYQNSTDNLAVQKKNLVDSRSVRQNIDESAAALKESLEVLRLANQVHDLVAKQNHYAALRVLDELQSSLQHRETSRYKIGDLIDKSIPATQKMIAEAVMNDLNTWLYLIRDVSQYVGEVAFYVTEQRRSRQKERSAKDEYLGGFKLNTPIELVADETEEYDVLNNEEAEVQVDFTPLFECLHIHEALGRSDRFRSEYANTRRRQKDLILPTILKLDDEEASELKTLLESIAGFSIVERATLKRTENLRTSVDVDELWDSMSQSAITLMSNAINGVESAEKLLKITSVVSLFIQTMESWQFYSSSCNAFLMTLFEQSVRLWTQNWGHEFLEIVSTDDYMPMPVSDLEEYDRIIDVGWYVPDKDRQEITFPCVFPFSQMYPMCCVDIRNFLNQVYSAPDDYLQRSSVIDETIRASLDDLLCNKICQPLIERLSSQYPGQIVQILVNLEHFQKACEELQSELAQARASRSRSAPVILTAVEEFRTGRKAAERRIYELVNSKIDDLVETAEYEWSTTIRSDEPSNYMSELTRYLSNIMSSVLLGLPAEIKEYIYLSALNHAASNILSLPVDSNVHAISPASLHNLQIDISHLTAFVDSLALPSLEESANDRPEEDLSAMDKQNLDTAIILKKSLEELTQTISLMSSTNPDEFYDISQRNRKYGKVDPVNGAVLLEKVEKGKTIGAPKGRPAEIRKTGDEDSADGSSIYSKFSASDRFGNVMRGFRRGIERDGGNG